MPLPACDLLHSHALVLLASFIYSKSPSALSNVWANLPQDRRSAVLRPVAIALRLVGKIIVLCAEVTTSSRKTVFPHHSFPSPRANSPISLSNRSVESSTLRSISSGTPLVPSKGGYLVVHRSCSLLHSHTVGRVGKEKNSSSHRPLGQGHSWLYLGRYGP